MANDCGTISENGATENPNHVGKYYTQIFYEVINIVWYFPAMQRQLQQWGIVNLCQ